MPRPQNNHNRTQEETLAPRTAPHPVQYTRTPGTCATARRDSFHFISFHFISFHFISFHFISFHFISFHFISFHFISFHFISFHFISFHFISFHFISFHFISFHFISFHFISFHFISFHFISFHFISFHFISFHFIQMTHSSTHGTCTLCVMSSCARGFAAVSFFKRGCRTRRSPSSSVSPFRRRVPAPGYHVHAR